MLSVLAVICGADSFVVIALFGQLNEAWLRTFLALPHGIPSHDALGWVLARLDASGLEEGFRDWVHEALELTAARACPLTARTRAALATGSAAWSPCIGSVPVRRPTAWCWPRRRWTTGPAQAQPSRNCCACCA